jgi:hypothetical protein
LKFTRAKPTPTFDCSVGVQSWTRPRQRERVDRPQGVEIRPDDVAARPDGVEAERAGVGRLDDEGVVLAPLRRLRANTSHRPAVHVLAIVERLSSEKSRVCVWLTAPDTCAAPQDCSRAQFAHPDGGLKALVGQIVRVAAAGMRT